ncbi:MAG: glycosyltransferase family 39 protein [Candidatus Kaelpia aquatica]|nr:glycosyltransferase family 39 protein [Candidatus Kaelpia aquatica]
MTAHIAIGSESISGDDSTPLYSLVTSVLLFAFQKSEFIFRFTAMFFGLLSIFGIYKLTTLLFDKHIGLISAVLLSFSPMHIWYSQEARGGALATFFSICSIYFFISLLKKEYKIHLWILFIISTTLGLYSSYFIVLLIIPELIILFLEKKWSLVPKVIMCWMVSLLFFLPWLLMIMQEGINVLRKDNFWINKPSLKTLICTWDVINVGYNSYNISYLAARIITPFLILSCFIHDRKKINAVLNFFILFFIPIFLIFLVSQIRSVYLIRKMIIFLPFYLSMLSYGFILFRKKNVGKILVLLYLFLCGSSILNYYKNYAPAPTVTSAGYGNYIKEPFKPIVNYIKNNLQKFDAVGFSSMSVNCSIPYYWGEENIFYFFYIPSSQDVYVLKELIEPQKSWNKTIINLSKEFLSPSPDRVWVISSSWDRKGELDPESLAVKSWFEQRYPKIQEQEFDGVIVSLFDTTSKSN